MRSGRLRHRVDIQRDVSDEGDLGPVWAVMHSGVPCRVEHVKGDERSQRDDQTEAIATHKVTLRWLEGMSTQLRLNYYGQLLNIVDVADDGRRHEMRLMCREAAA